MSAASARRNPDAARPLPSPTPPRRTRSTHSRVVISDLMMDRALDAIVRRAKTIDRRHDIRISPAIAATARSSTSTGTCRRRCAMAAATSTTERYLILHEEVDEDADRSARPALSARPSDRIAGRAGGGARRLASAGTTTTGSCKIRQAHRRRAADQGAARSRPQIIRDEHDDIWSSGMPGVHSRTRGLRPPRCRRSVKRAIARHMRILHRQQQTAAQIEHDQALLANDRSGRNIENVGTAFRYPTGLRRPSDPGPSDARALLIGLRCSRSPEPILACTACAPSSRVARSAEGLCRASTRSSVTVLSSRSDIGTRADSFDVSPGAVVRTASLDHALFAPRFAAAGCKMRHVPRDCALDERGIEAGRSPLFSMHSSMRLTSRRRVRPDGLEVEIGRHLSARSSPMCLTYFCMKPV